ncbi:MAG: PLP-dependent aminotransferase family protein [Eubacteriaceae bacterium]|nr:PLP-dependent aminotransferase family protein [Eubacteriaceae bacterium]
MAKYAKRMDNMYGSATRAMLKITRDPEIISFAGGLPAPELFPIQEYKETAANVIEQNGKAALQYGPTEGYLPLREKLADRMKKYQINTQAENILITSGSQQGLDFTAKLMIDPGDIIICEKPTYLGAMTAFNAYEPEYIEVDTDDNGMKMAELEKVLKENSRVKFIYVIPDFQNPSGRTWSLENRCRLVELANEYDVIILEDCPYSELRFEGENLPAVKYFDKEGKVILLGTFSKIFSPGLRLGWMVAEKEIIDKINLIKQGADLQSSTISQMEMDYYLEHYDIEKHIAIVNSKYKARRDLMIQCMEKEFPKEVSYTYPKGGLFIWVTLPAEIDAADVSDKALEKKVAFILGEAFYPNEGAKNNFRMNFSNMNEERIVEGIHRLGIVLHEMIDK